MGLTNEQKLLILLQKAVENGWECFIDLDPCFLELKNIEKLEISVWHNHGSYYYSINDVVLNFEPGKIDFVEALFTALINEGLETSGSYVSQFKIDYILFPTSDRLEYLFTTFNELLK